MLPRRAAGPVSCSLLWSATGAKPLRPQTVADTSGYSSGDNPNSNTGEPFRHDNTTRVATNSVFLNPKHPSHLLLPVVKGMLP